LSEILARAIPAFPDARHPAAEASLKLLHARRRTRWSDEHANRTGFEILDLIVPWLTNRASRR